MDIYNKYYRSLKTRLRCEDADDVAQETFKKLWIKRNDLHLIAHPEQYIFTIARNIFLKGKNDETKNRTVMKGFQATYTDFDKVTDDDILYKDTRRLVDSWMHRLPSRLRQTYAMKKDGYKLKEISRHLNIKEQTVKNFLQKAEKKMEGLKKEIF